MLEPSPPKLSAWQLTQFVVTKDLPALASAAENGSAYARLLSNIKLLKNSDFMVIPNEM
jgi:hypothetical protein